MKRVPLKAQSGVNAAVLVAIISTLIIIYIIFLPAGEKGKILENRTAGKSSNGNGESTGILLREFPGTLSSVEGVEDEKSLPNVFLVETKNAKEIATINPFIVSKSVFGEKIKKENFELQEPENIDNIILAFNAKARKGILTIKVNDKVVYENELTASTETVKISRSLLSKNNVIEFSVSSPGIKFWRTNSYSIDDIKIIGDVTDRTRQESQNLFVLSETEFRNIEKSELKFIPYCKNVQVGALDILINSKKVFSAVPVCDDPYKQIVPTSALKQGENTVVFRTNKGSYSVERVSINFAFKEAKAKTYYFEVNRTDIKSINESRKDAILSIKFTENSEDKVLKLDVNGHLTNIDTRKSSHSKNINSDIGEGNNFVRLTPDKEDIEIVELKVELVKK